MILEALVLAAGRARRFGSQKLLASWGEGVLVGAALARALSAPVRSVHLVSGADAAAVEAAARDQAARMGVAGRLRFVRASRYMEGMSESLKAGVAALPEDVDGVFVYLGDMPAAPGPEAALLAAALRDHDAAVFFRDGRRGHPALLGRALFGEVGTLTGDAGAGRILDRLGERMAVVESADEGVHRDVDRPEDLPPGAHAAFPPRTGSP